jgi:hypothetical protein
MAKEKIQPLGWYSGIRAYKIIGFKNRQALVKYISNGSLRAITVNEIGDAGRRYAIKGEWLISFIDRFKRGVAQGEKYTVHELKMMLQGTLDYCKEHNLKTLEELIKSVRRLK